MTEEKKEATVLKFPQTIRLYRQRDSAIIPSFGTKDSACFDVSASLEAGMTVTTYDQNNHKDAIPVNADGEYILLPYNRALIPTGWVFGIPRGYSIRLHPRSGLSLKNGIVLANAEAVIDEDYTNETFVMLVNTTTERFTIKNGDRVCQGELTEKIATKFREESGKIGETTRKGGFGSSGLNKNLYADKE